MPKGRKPKTAAVKAAKSSRRAPKGTVKSSLQESPLELDEIARAEWKRFGQELADRGTHLQPSDRSAMAIYCGAFSRWVRANEEIRNNGIISFTDSGGVKSNPAVAAANQAEATMARILDAFGCTPASRNRVANSGSGTNDKLSEFLAKKPKL